MFRFSVPSIFILVKSRYGKVSDRVRDGCCVGGCSRTFSCWRRSAWATSVTWLSVTASRIQVADGTWKRSSCATFFSQSHSGSFHVDGMTVSLYNLHFLSSRVTW